MRCSPVAVAARTSTSTVLRSHTNVHAHSGTPLMLSCPTSFFEIFPVAPSLQLHRDELLALSPNVQRAKNCVLPPPRGVSFHLLIIHNIFGWYGVMWLPFWAVFLSIAITGATDTKITDITQVLDELPTCLVWFNLRCLARMIKYRYSLFQVQCYSSAVGGDSADGSTLSDFCNEEGPWGKSQGCILQNCSVLDRLCTSFPATGVSILGTNERRGQRNPIPGLHPTNPDTGKAILLSTCGRDSSLDLPLAAAVFKLEVIGWGSGR